MSPGIPRATDLVPPLGTTLLWEECVAFSSLLPPLTSMARVVGKTFGSARVVTTIAGVTLTKFSLIYFITLYI
jgi:hypothetical protein